MNWDDLRVFLAVARAERLSAAAAMVGKDATTVSRRLKRLERVLERRLFEHTPAGHVLTEHGVRLLEQAERIEAAALDMQRSDSAATEVSGTIRLSASEGFGSRVIAARLKSFSAQHPRVQIDLVASSGLLNPSRREADLAVMLARPKSGPLLTRKLTDYRLGLYARADYLASAPPLKEPAHLVRHVLIGYVPDQIYAPELRYLAEIDARLEPVIRSTSINAQAVLIDSGAGCGILPCFIGDAMPMLRRVLPDAVDINRTFWLVIPRDLRGIVRIDRFVDWLVQEAELLRPSMMGTARS